MKRIDWARLAGALAFSISLAACTTTTGKNLRPDGTPAEGVEVGERSSFRTLIPEAELEQAADQQYQALLSESKKGGVLVSKSNAQAKRLDRIAKRIIPFTTRFNPDSSNWKWEVNLLKTKEANAFCMPGGKIAFYTGLIDGLKLSDDEIAIVMGHEMAHALREHARAQMGKAKATSTGLSIFSAATGGKHDSLLQMGENLLNLKFSRDDESEADAVGLDLAARAGYDPRAGISLWNKMGGNSSLDFLSTHPSDSNRIQHIESLLPNVMPLYEKAIAQKGGSGKKARSSGTNKKQQKGSK
ncbi:MAG: M48 family metallopeptidase [Zoogloeaceae bacterium]|nr:M48 family metallopeptidase [Zoogloeaceae bacterium]